MKFVGIVEKEGYTDILGKYRGTEADQLVNFSSCYDNLIFMFVLRIRLLYGNI